MQTRNLSYSENLLRKFGKLFITPIFSIGSGIITAVAVSALPFLVTLSLPWLIILLGAVFISETIVSIYLFKDSVPETLSSIFVTKNIFNNLSPRKKGLMGLGIFSALGGGFAVGALTYSSATAAISAILGLFSIACPPLGIAIAGVLGLVGLVAFTGLLVKWIDHAIRSDIHIRFINFFKETFTRNLEKPLSQQVLESFFKLLFVGTIVAVTVIGTVATLGTMQKGLTMFLSLIPKANQLAVMLASGLIAYLLMGAARLPWALQSACVAFARIGEKIGYGMYCLAGIFMQCAFSAAPSKKNIPAVQNEKGETWLGSLAKISAVLIHGFSFGAIAKSGGGQVLSDLQMDMHLAQSVVSANQVGQTASLISGGVMAGAIGAFTLFFKPAPKKGEKIVKEKIQYSKNSKNQK